MKQKGKIIAPLYLKTTPFKAILPLDMGIKNFCLILGLIIDGFDTNIQNLKHCDRKISG